MERDRLRKHAHVVLGVRHVRGWSHGAAVGCVDTSADLDRSVAEHRGPGPGRRFPA
jgi:hypothetical protein